MRGRSDSRLGGPDVLLLGSIVGLPWAFGGVEVWAYRAAALVIAAAWAWHAIRIREGAPLLPAGAAAWLFPAAGLIAWAGFQAQPLPAGVVRALSPAAAAVQREAPAGTIGELEVYALGHLPGDLPPAPEGGGAMPEGGAPRPRRAPTLSLAPDATLESAFWWGALLLAGLLATSRAADAERRAAYGGVIVAALAALALAGFAQAATWNGKMLWIREIEGGRPFGPYINGNHFGGAMELATPWLAGLAIARFRGSGGWRPLALGAAALLCLAAGVAAQSKFAAAAMAISSSVLALAAAPTPRTRRRIAIALIAAGAAGAAVVAVTPLGERFRDFVVVDMAAPAQTERIVSWKASLPMWADHPLTGIGFGAFGRVFPRYLPAGEAQPWAQLHNDPLEMAVSGGIVGAALLVWLALAAARRLAAGHRAIESRRGRIANLGLLLGIGSLGLHAFVDFNHQIPANALLFVAAAAVAAPVPPGAGDGRR